MQHSYMYLVEDCHVISYCSKAIWQCTPFPTASLEDSSAQHCQLRDIYNKHTAVKQAPKQTAQSLNVYCCSVIYMSVWWCDLMDSPALKHENKFVLVIYGIYIYICTFTVSLRVRAVYSFIDVICVYCDK